mgnify:CR=1 FL=1
MTILSRTGLILAAFLAAVSTAALGEEPLAVPDPRWGAFFLR